MFLKTTTIPDAWYQAIYNLVDYDEDKKQFKNGILYTIDQGSYEGSRRLEYPYIMIEINNPLVEPYIPDFPPAVQLPPIADMDYVFKYFQDYIMNPEIPAKEVYCYSDDTEILTNKGWKYIKDLEDLDRKETVATLNPSTFEIEYQLPVEYLSFDYSDTMYHCQTKQIDLKITKNHMMFCSVPTQGKNENHINKFKLISIEDICKRYRTRFKRSGIWVGKEQEFFMLPPVVFGKNFYKRKNIEQIPMDDFLKFLGIWMAEGNLRNNSYGIVITQYCPKTRQIIKEALSKIFHIIEYDIRLIISNKQLYSWLLQFGKSDTKSIPEEFLQLSTRQLNILLEWLYLGDGTKPIKRKSIFHLYTTVSKKLADNIQEICLKTGRAARIIEEEPNSWGRKKVYRVHISETEAYCSPHLFSHHIKKVPYKGKVVCIKVPKYHIIYVRRNGKACWSGNTYGSRICKKILGSKTQLQILIERLIFHPHSNQLILQIAEPEDILLNDAPCMRSCQLKVIDNRLDLHVLFRSNSLFSAFPVNMASMALLMEYILTYCENLIPGKIIYFGSGLHLYEHDFDLVKTRLCRPDLDLHKRTKLEETNFDTDIPNLQKFFKQFKKF